MAFILLAVAIPVLFGWDPDVTAADLTNIPNEGLVDWAETHYGDDPSKLILEVNGSTSEENLEKIRFIFNTIPGWRENLTGVALNRYRFFIG